jgi:Reverse transcriptase (RNA-dependent DNA polymerase)
LRSLQGVFKDVVMPLGLSNGPASFQRYFNGISLPLVKYNLCVYLDDILIPSSDSAKNPFLAQKVVDLLIAAKLTAKPQKCSFFPQEIEYVGFK